MAGRDARRRSKPLLHEQYDHDIWEWSGAGLRLQGNSLRPAAGARATAQRNTGATEHQRKTTSGTNIAGQTAQAKGRLRRLERLKRDRLIARPRRQHHIHVNLKADLRSGDKVLMTYGLVAGYERERPLVTVPDITLYRGEAAALIGPNGIGKTTLLKTLLREIPALSGSARLGAAVQPGYFAQAHEGLDADKSVLDELLTVRNLPLSEARNYLAAYLFTGDDVFRPVSTLSGGERGRLALAKLSLDGANFLLLDEPTNHLDIESQEILQDVLAAFNGTILLVSHDRYLIDALATQVWDLQADGLTIFEGTYREYLATRVAARQAARDAGLLPPSAAATRREAPERGCRTSSTNDSPPRSSWRGDYRAGERA